MLKDVRIPEVTVDCVKIPWDRHNPHTSYEVKCARGCVILPNTFVHDYAAEWCRENHLSAHRKNPEAMQIKTRKEDGTYERLVEENKRIWMACEARRRSRNDRSGS
jgi:hypothetical protein